MSTSYPQVILKHTYLPYLSSIIPYKYHKHLIFYFLYASVIMLIYFLGGTMEELREILQNGDTPIDKCYPELSAEELKELFKE